MGRLLGRFPPYRRFISRQVWREFLSDPEAKADLDQGMADLKAGRTYHWNDGDTFPADSWQPDDPIQPDGWYHDGTQWIRGMGRHG